MFVVHLNKEPFKFSCSHFTILSSDRSERLHGHNYQLGVALEVDQLNPELGMAFDFNAVKPLIRGFCDQLDERILLPSHSRFLAFERTPESVEIRFGAKRYIFPVDDALFLPVVNITSEELARFACESLAQVFVELNGWTALQVQIEETRGQSVSYRQTR